MISNDDLNNTKNQEVNFSQKISGLAKWIRRMLDIKGVIVKKVRNKSVTVSYSGREYIFAVPNAICQYRADTFYSKEPETLTWIDGFSEDSIFWDIGANVGLYSIYAAKKGCRVFSFEPSVFNLEFLARNISLNNLSSLMCIIPLAVSEKTTTGLLHMSSTEWGGALSTYDKTFGYEGEELKQVFEYATLSVTIDDAVSKLALPRPDYLKIDVDGIEHLILSGGSGVLNSAKGVLVEISDKFLEQSILAKKYLEEAGLTLSEKYRNINQIWCRN